MPEVTTRRDEEAVPLEAKALLFSGGVDSFYSALNAPQHDLLVSAHGFDIPLSDQARMDTLRGTLTKVAASRGMKPIVIRTNFREHPVAGRGPLWERAHGGVLAAFGQARQAKCPHVDTCEEVFTKAATPNERSQIRVGPGNQLKITAHFAVCSKR